MKLNRIARILYNLSLDMDYADNLDHAEEEIKCIEKELSIMKINKCDSLLQTLEMIAMQNKKMEFWKESLTK